MQRHLKYNVQGKLMVAASNRPTKTSLIDTGMKQLENWACANGPQHHSQTCLWQFSSNNRNCEYNSARHTSSRVTQADAAGAHYNTKEWRCVHRSKHEDGMVQDWPSPKKGTPNDQMGVHIGQW